MNEKVPKQILNFNFHIWDSSKWKITLNNGKYFFDKYHNVSNSSSYPGWRLVNIFLCMFLMLNNGAYYLCNNLIYGRYGLRSMFGFVPFSTGLSVDPTDGTVCPECPYLTWFGRLKLLWQNIFESRKNFEEDTRTGILNRGFSRIFNMAYNYFFKGIIGSICILVSHPLLFVIHSTANLLGIALMPLMAIVFSFMYYLINILILDKKKFK